MSAPDRSMRTNMVLRGAATICLGLSAFATSAQEVVRYIHTDALGSPVAESDESGAVVARFVYEPYGANIGSAPEDSPGFTGHVSDKETGLTYMQQRYYDPVVGLFLSSDPVTASASPVSMFNRYRYANSNPYRFYDPDGRCTGSRMANGDGTCKSTGEFTTQASSATSLDARNVDKVFTHSSVSTMGGEATASAFPGETRTALKKFLGSGVGGAIGRRAVQSGEKIDLEQILPSSGYPPVFSAGYAGNNIVTYSLQWREFLKSNKLGREFSGAGLDVLLAHEIGHTPMAGATFGYSAATSNADADEFNAVRFLENPYRQYLGMPLRTHYSGLSVPDPLVGGN
jgi:RHS repeat-associated protein